MHQSTALTKLRRGAGEEDQGDADAGSGKSESCPKSAFLFQECRRDGRETCKIDDAGSRGQLSSPVLVIVLWRLTHSTHCKCTAM